MKKVKRAKKAQKHRKNTVKPAPDPDKVTVIPGRNGGQLHLAKKGYTANPNGRPRRFVSQLAKGNGYTQTEVRECMEDILSMTEADLRKVAKNPNVTVLEKTLAKALLKGSKNGTTGNLESVITRSFGYPNKSVEVKNTGEKPLATLNVTVVKSGTPELSSSEDKVDVKKKKDGQ